MSKISKLELRRQLFHAILGITIVVLLNFNIINAWHIFAVLIFGFICSFLQKQIKLPIISTFLKYMGRPEEKSFPGKGAFFFFFGTLLALKLFPKDIALAAIIILALGDSVSHIVGRTFGTIKNPLNKSNNKLLEGTFFGILVAFLGAIFFVSPIEALIASTAAMFFELAEVKFGESILDDNILIPLIAGVTIVLLRIVI